MNRIERHYLSLSKSEKIVADYVKSHFNEAQFLTTLDFSKKLNVGKTTVIRFAKKIGFKGFSDFKQSLVHHAGKLQNVTAFDDDNSDDFASRLRKLTKANMAALEETSKLIDETNIMHTVNEILSSNRVLLVGVGSSGITAQDAKHKLLHIGVMTDAITDIHSLERMHHIVEEHDLIIGLSVSGETTSVIDALRTAKSQGTKVIAVTYAAGSTVTEFADIIITSAARDWAENTKAFAAKIAQLQVIDILFSELYRRKFE